jgi:hypothetical protein
MRRPSFLKARVGCADADLAMDGVRNEPSVLHLISRRMVERPVQVLLSSELVRALGRPDDESVAQAEGATRDGARDVLTASPGPGARGGREDGVATGARAIDVRA